MLNSVAVLQHLSASAFATAVEHLSDNAALAWLREHKDAEVPTEVLADLMARGYSAMDQAIAARPHLPADIVEALVATTRATVARDVAEREDLTVAHLERLLTRDDAQVSLKVWEHPACTDELRTKILSGVTMNPRSRNVGKLVEVPHVTVPDHLRDVARASACPRTVAAGWQGASSDRQLRDQMVAVAAAALQHFEGRSPYHVRELHMALRSAAQSGASRAGDPELRAAFTTIVSAASRYGRTISQEIRDAVDKLAATTVPDACPEDDAPIDRAVLAALRDGTARTAHLADLRHLTGIDVAELHVASVKLLIEHRPELLGVDWIGEQLAAGTLPEGAQLPAAVCDQLAAAGHLLPVKKLGRYVRHVSYTTQVEACIPAREAFGLRSSGECNARIGRLVSRVLGDSRERWETFAALEGDFGGSISQLLATVVALTDGDAAEIDTAA